MSGSEPRHFLQPCLLLLLAESPDHGYDLVERLRKLGVADTDSASVYRTLRTLERAGWVGSAWTPSRAGPARRTYHLTGDGYAALESGVAEFRGVRDVLECFLRRYDALQDASTPPGALHRPPGGSAHSLANGTRPWSPAGH